MHARHPRPARREPGSLQWVSTEDNFDLVAAGLRDDSAELSMSVEVLAAKLEQALPGRASVERRGAGLLGRREKRVQSVRVDLGSSCYQLIVEGERLEGFRERQVGGIAIKRESMSAAEWMAALTETLRAEAESSADARAALQRLLS
jgi:hypothetical protein